MQDNMFRVQHHAVLGSTSDEAKRLAALGCAHGTVVWADEQTAGRGRFGRTWQSPRDNLSMSVVLRPSVSSPRVAELGFVAAVTLAECVGRWLAPGRGAGLKWPNDVLVDGAKIAGILLEAESVAGTLDWVVLGIGLNLAQAPEGVAYPVTTLRAHGAAVTPEYGLRAVLTGLAAWLPRWEKEGFGLVRGAWLAHAIGLGREVEVRIGDRLACGVFRDLDADGAMILATTEGVCRITAGEVAFGVAT